MGMSHGNESLHSGHQCRGTENGGAEGLPFSDLLSDFAMNFRPERTVLIPIKLKVPATYPTSS